MEMEDTCRNERIIKMLEQHTIDQKLVYENFSKQIQPKMKAPVKK